MIPNPKSFILLELLNTVELPYNEIERSLEKVRYVEISLFRSFM